jgi:D-alanyl-lipoteichoic acid acyltransferase DltB (MBOAT superfamily)
MLFNSYIFLLLFLPVTYAGYRLLIRYGRQESALLWLNVCSFFFYGWWNPAYIPLMFGSIAINFLIGQQLHRQAHKSSGRMLLILGVTLNLLCLGYFKYTHFILDNLNDFFGTHYYQSDIILPLAISFFTFQQIAYLVDTWNGKGDNYHFRYYCLFVVFFPHLLAGPIVHHREIIPQFLKPEDTQQRTQHLAMALTAISFGLFKKVILADSFAFYANQLFERAQTDVPIGFFDAWIGAVSFTLQIYFDFSAYSDIACGIALLFGVRLPQNFASPYRATSIIEFWQSWHMTLSRFLRNYVYIPLGGNRKGPVNRYLNLVITMLLGGLWHGAGWPFILWGAMQGGLLMINHAWRALTTSTPANATKQHTLRIPTSIAWLLTYICIVLSWVVFRADNTDSVWRIYHAMFDVTSLQWEHSLRQPVINDICRQLGWQIPTLWKILPVLFLLQLWVLFLPNLQQLMQGYRLTPTALPNNSTRWHWEPNWRWSTLTALSLSASLMALHDTGNFIYFQF